MATDTEKRALESEPIETFSSALRLDPTKISSNCFLEELRIDSMDLVEAVFQFEEPNYISIPFNANAQATLGSGATRTVGDLLDTVTSRILAKRGTSVAS